jgi:phosphatidylglycerophosphate synthase
MTPNQVTGARVAMAFVAVLLFGRNAWADAAALVLTVGAIGLDAVDGYLARRHALSTPLGAQLDILGDRVVENLFFTFFAVAGLISLWVPVFFFVRGTLTDFLRTLAMRTGRSGFGKNSMLDSRWGRALVASRASRAGYGVMKCVCFCYLGLELTLPHMPAGFSEAQLLLLPIAAQVLVASTVAFCIVRAVPVLWEGRRYLSGLSPTLTKTTTGSAR